MAHRSNMWVLSLCLILEILPIKIQTITETAYPGYCPASCSCRGSEYAPSVDCAGQNLTKIPASLSNGTTHLLNQPGRVEKILPMAGTHEGFELKILSYQDLSLELQCPICQSDLSHPKVIGQCLHSACLECLEQLVATLGKDSFPCPLCRQSCSVPPEGVTGLKDDFRLRAIVEKYQQAKKNKTSIKCTICSGIATHLCEKCQWIFLCQSCRRNHDQNPLTSAHEMLGICLQHGRTLVMYCKKCNKAICSACMIVEHPCSDQYHDVVPHHKVVDDNVAMLETALRKLEGMQEQKEIKLQAMQEIQDTVSATMDSDMQKVVQQSTSALSHADERCCKLATKSCSLQEQIDALQKQKEAVDNEFVKSHQKREKLLQTKVEYCQRLNRQRDACFANFQQAFAEAVQEKDNMQAKLDFGHTQMSVRRVLDGETVPNILQKKEELEKCCMAAEQVDRAAPLVNAKDTLVRFVPAADNFEIGDLLRKDFTNLKLVAQLSYPSYIAIPKVVRVRHVPDGHLVSLCVCRDVDADLADTLCLHDPANPENCLLKISKDVFPAVDMTITSTGEVMVLRRAEPSIRVFNIGTGAVRDIASSFDKKAKVTQVWAVETDKKSNIFITYGSLKRHLCVLNSHGVVIHDVVQVPHARRMAYCPRTSILHIAGGDVLGRCHWDGKMLSGVSSTLHGIDRFWCWDVCISIDRGMFVVGSKDNVIHIYQVKDPEDILEAEVGSSDEASISDDSLYGSGIHSENEVEGKEFKMVRMNFFDRVERQCRKSPFIPLVSVRDRDLVLGYHTKTELFKITM